MSPSRYVFLSAAGRRLAVPVESVVAVREWEEPRVLPGGKDWLKGVLEGNGEAIPVLKAAFWGNGTSEEHILVLVEWGGFVLALAGHKPDLQALDGEVEAPDAEETAPVYIAGTIEHEGGTADCVRVDKLYSVLGLRYNKPDRIGGTDAEEDTFSR
jgi:chemotaxis signal transduction protein